MSEKNGTRETVLGYPVDLLSENQALDKIEAAWKAADGLGRHLHVVTLNAEMVVTSQKDRELDRIVRHADLIVPDGAGVVFALRTKGAAVSRLPGIELAHAALARAARLSQPVALLGGRAEVMEKLVQVLPAEHPGLTISAFHNGYFAAQEEREVVETLAQSRPKLVLVALGVPRQEYLIDRYKQTFPHSVVIGVGGSFDVWTGFVERAPAVYRRFHLEWLARLIKEPWRFKRMAGTLPNFAMQVLAEKYLGKGK